MRKLIVASSNKGKLIEISKLLSGLYEIVPMKDTGYDGEPIENGKTFYENALIKAKTVSEALGEDALADDSGLCVEALGDAPGIYSARYAGIHGNDKANNTLLLKNLKGITNRKAKFCCSVVLYRADGSVVSGYGETIGQIDTEERGTNGFGYDCLFISDDIKKNFGLADEEEKNSCSHRFRALQELTRQL